MDTALHDHRLRVLNRETYTLEAVPFTVFGVRYPLLGFLFTSVQIIRSPTSLRNVMLQQHRFRSRASPHNLLSESSSSCPAYWRLKPKMAAASPVRAMTITVQVIHLWTRSPHGGSYTPGR